jgi:hypothetical protein
MAMMLALPLVFGLTLALFMIYLAERRFIRREVAEREVEGTRHERAERHREPAAVTSDEGQPQPAPLRSRRVPVGVAVGETESNGGRPEGVGRR